jgi:ubiquinone/menaquinone biosynthesis C-methylase UbiE
VIDDPFLREWLQPDIDRIEAELPTTAPDDIPSLFAPISLDAFVLLLLEPLDDHPNLRRFLPLMPDESLQRMWNGETGVAVLTHAVRFLERVNTAKPLRGSTVLDCGCGWGRTSRLLSKFTPTDRIYGVDPSEAILRQIDELDVKGTYELIDHLPDRLPYRKRFDVIYAFSVLTHLSEEAALNALNIWRKYLSSDGLVAATIRGRSYWQHIQHPNADELMHRHDEYGFAFAPRSRAASSAANEVAALDRSREDRPRATRRCQRLFRWGRTARTSLVRCHGLRACDVDAVLTEHRDHSLGIIGSNDRPDMLADVEDERDRLVSSIPVEVEPQARIRRPPQPPWSDASEADLGDRSNLCVRDPLCAQERAVATNDEGVVRARDQAVVVIHLDHIERYGSGVRHASFLTHA